MPRKLRLNDERPGGSDHSPLRSFFHRFPHSGISEKTLEEIGAEDGSSIFRERRPDSPRSPRSPRRNEFTSSFSSPRGLGKERFPATTIARAKRALRSKMERALQRASSRAVSSVENCATFERIWQKSLTRTHMQLPQKTVSAKLARPEAVIEVRSFKNDLKILPKSCWCLRNERWMQGQQLPCSVLRAFHWSLKHHPCVVCLPYISSAILQHWLTCLLPDASPQFTFVYTKVCACAPPRKGLTTSQNIFCLSER
jgi:hypothetical protein